tara:strand:- start:3230 stop:4396 length:1167 start_codon:yes stop_codon:yes gene_type:complete
LEIKIFQSLFQLKKEDWDLLTMNASPFISYEFLGALENTDCIGKERGQIPFYFTLWEEESLRACYYLFLKGHSYGEYIFDWAWADAFQKSGLPYYPKFCSQTPFTPISDSKLLIHPDYLDSKAKFSKILQKAVFDVAKKIGTSSIHVLYIHPHEKEYFSKDVFLHRKTHQYHFKNKGYKSFTDFLNGLEKSKRKQIQKERNYIAKQSGLVIKQFTCESLEESHAELWYQCYLSTIKKKWAQAYLNEKFFKEIFKNLSDKTLLVLAFRGESLIAGSLFLYDNETLYGRYWGALEKTKFLHFEMCYYQGLDFVFSKGLDRFEAGAQGEHKIKRGFLPERIWSAHYIENQIFREAISQFINDEGKSLEDFFEVIEKKMNPYKKRNSNAKKT